MLSAVHHMQVARLQSQLAAAQLDVQTAREQAALAAIEGPVSSWGPCCVMVIPCQIMYIVHLLLLPER